MFPKLTTFTFAFFPNRTYGAGRTQGGLCPKFLVVFAVSSFVSRTVLYLGKLKTSGRWRAWRTLCVLEPVRSLVEPAFLYKWGIIVDVQDARQLEGSPHIMSTLDADILSFFIKRAGRYASEINMEYNKHFACTESCFPLHRTDRACYRT